MKAETVLEGMCHLNKIDQLKYQINSLERDKYHILFTDSYAQGVNPTNEISISRDDRKNADNNLYNKVKSVVLEDWNEQLMKVKEELEDL